MDLDDQKCCTVSLKLGLILLAVGWFIGALSFSVHAEEDKENLVQEYRNYRQRLDGIRDAEDLAEKSFQVIDEQTFSVTLQAFGDVFFIPALDKKYHRLALFFARPDGSILFKTDQLATNRRSIGELRQPNQGIAAVSFQDVNGDTLTDIVLITYCVNETGAYAGKTYKVGDVLLQKGKGFYQDYRLSDKINRFSMNKSIKFITSFLQDGCSTEFLYTSTTREELDSHGFKAISGQQYWRSFERFGRLCVVPGTYHMAEYTVFVLYLVNEQGYILWSFQPMDHYENLYAFKGITCQDINGDGLKDIVVLGRYSSEGKDNKQTITNDYAIYYQKTSGFYPDTEFREQYLCKEQDTLEGIVKKARAFWGWKLDQ